MTSQVSTPTVVVELEKHPTLLDMWVIF